MGRGARRSRLNPHRRGQEGIALVEALIAVAVVSLTVVALFAGLYTILLSTNSHRRTVRSGIEATTIAEAARLLTYVNCETPAAMQNRLLAGATPVYTPPTGYSLTIAEVRYLDDLTTNAPSFSASCPSPDRGVQRIVVRVTATGAPNVTEEVVVHKRRDTCPAGIGPVPGERC